MPASKRDYYEVLGVDKNASADDIKRAYRKKAKEYHPDLHPGDKEAEEKFKEINEANEVLSDPDKRARYDQFGFEDPTQGFGGGGNPFAGGGIGGFGMDDILNSFFGGGFGGGFGSRSAGRDAPMAGDDLRYNLLLTFEEAAFGVTKELLIPREESCEACGGTGAKKGTRPVRCPTCNGTGQVRTQQNTMFGAFTTSRPCSACNGTGKYIKDPCPDCRGKGRVRKNTRIQLKVPAGINDGQTINMRGEGEAGYKGGPRGNLYVTVSVKPHKLFTRDGCNLLLSLKVPFTTMALGGEITVPTLKEKVRYTIPSGTQNGTTFRLKEQGVPIPNASNQSKGDLLVTVESDIPRRLSDEQRALLQQYAALSGEATTPSKKKGGIRNIFK
ncbi:MAG: molecular chaperone DnaJ [Clostridia bacterium]|nr:molecular chaperone DnaJ [Clostridia bacterium]